MTHDLLLSKNGIAAPKQHALRLAIERHKARLNAELTKARLRAGHATIASWKDALALSADDTSDETQINKAVPRLRHPRWIRINTLRTTLDSELQSTFKQYEHKTLKDILSVLRPSEILTKDDHIPDLVAVPHGQDLTKHPAYTSGCIIFQDKASCIPAYLLDPRHDDRDVLDACAAPGNKTTHLAALSYVAQQTTTRPKQTQTIFACERDKARSVTLEQMIRKAGADQDNRVQILARQDFLKLDPADPRFKSVGALLLDPSCSGSGIVGRDDGEAEKSPCLVLPRTPTELADAGDKASARDKKRKRPDAKLAPKAKPVSAPVSTRVETVSEAETVRKPLAERLEALSSFQLTLLKHAFTFPAAHKIVYSTCSIHAEENEHVVVRALSSAIARKRGWRICRRDEQVDGMQRWKVRGDKGAVEDMIQHDTEGGENEGLTQEYVSTIADACIRCEKGTEEGTQGFFAVKFVRDKPGLDLSNGANEAEEQNEEEWSGFSDEDS